MSGDLMAYVLEPLLVTAIHEPWSTQPYAFTETGPAMLVDLDTDEPIGSFDVGMTRVVNGDKRAWVLQSTSAEWAGPSPTAEPTPRTMSMVIVEREAFGLGKRVVLDPPIETPIALGDDLLDLSSGESSDRHVAVRLRHENGTSQVLADDIGRTPVWCTGTHNLVSAFEVPPNAVRVLQVQRKEYEPERDGYYWDMGRTDLGRTALGNTGIACGGTRVVLEVSNPDDNWPYLMVVELASGEQFSLAGLAAPFAISTDDTVVARRTSDDRFVLVKKSGEITELELFASRRALPQPILVNNQALISTGDEYHIVDLTKGTVSGALELEGGETVRAIPWADAHGFALMRYHNLQLTAVGIANANGGRSIGATPFVHDPQLLAASGNRMYVAASNDKGDRLVYGFDQNGGVSKATPPECDPHAITNGSCR